VHQPTTHVVDVREHSVQHVLEVGASSAVVELNFLSEIVLLMQIIAEKVGCPAAFYDAASECRQRSFLYSSAIAQSYLQQ
jgi:hypothetical protein